MIGIILPIYHHTDESANLEDLELDYELSECDVKDIIFYQINAISVHKVDGKDYTHIHANGTSYLCPYDIYYVKEQISLL